MQTAPARTWDRSASSSSRVPDMLGTALVSAVSEAEEAVGLTSIRGGVAGPRTPSYQ